MCVCVCVCGGGLPAVWTVMSQIFVVSADNVASFFPAESVTSGETCWAAIGV